MDLDIDKRVTQVAQRTIVRHVFPGCVVGYIRHSASVVKAFGSLTYANDSPVVKPTTIYDVASITKPIPTGLIIHMLVEQGRLSYEDPAAKYLPEIDNIWREEILIRHLLTYTMILSLPEGLSAPAKRGLDELQKALFKSPLKARPGEQYFYTNPPAIWLGMIAERVAGMPLDMLAKRLLFEPLGMVNTSFDTAELGIDDIAPSEIDWRGEIRGQIHDEAAWRLREAGQVAGNAGLFSTVPDLLRVAAMLIAGGTLEGARLLKPATVQLMHTNQIAEIGGSTGLGWEMNNTTFMGSSASDGAFAKTGFTGGLIMIDPEKQAAMVLLTNRTYPHRTSSRDEINSVRRELANIIFA